MRTSKTERTKQDRLSPTVIEQDNTPDIIKVEKDLSDGELQERLDLYSNGSKEQFFKVQKIKQRYVEKIKEEQIKRTKADLHYAQGVRAGLPHAYHDNLKDIRERQDQHFRDEILHEAKAEYKKQENLTKLFDRENPSKTTKQVPKINSQKIKVYNKLGKLMGAFKAVQQAKDNVISKVDAVESGIVNHNAIEELKPNQKTAGKTEKNLSKYFNIYTPEPKDIRKTFEKIKGMDRDR